MDSSGTCTLQTFIKVNQRLGVVLSNIHNFEKIFLYFARPGTSLLFYKEFIKEIFYFTSIKDRRIKYLEKPYSDKITFVEILIKKIFDKKGVFTLLELIKNIKIIDYEYIRRINFNDFIFALKKSDIVLDDFDKEKLFIEYNYFLNGIIKYEIMINLILEQFWDEHKDNLSEEIYLFLTNNGKRYISLNTIQKLFQNTMDDSQSKRKLMKFIEEYKLINNNSSINAISLKDMKRFLKYYNFGNCNDNCLKELLKIVEHEMSYDDYNVDIDRYNRFKPYFNELNCSNEKPFFSKSMDKYYLKNKKELRKIIKKLRKIFIEYGRKSFFNFIKQFRYYENNERQINRNDFKNVFNSYNINLTNEEIDIIFNKFCVDKNKNLIFYEDFLKYISVNSSNNKREDIIKYVYDTLIERCTNNDKNKDLDLDFLKEIYNPKNNYFIKDESENNLEFINCLETFHYSYKSFKSNLFYRKEFIAFYRFISFLIINDEDFVSLILHEWDVSPLLFDKFLTNNYDVYKNKMKDYFLYDLKNALFNKGVKGLVNLHLKFLSYCSNVSKITLYDFINILQLEHINFKKNDFNEIFNYFSLESDNNYLDYNKFIRFFKKELNNTKLNVVEKIFLSLQNDRGYKEELTLNEIKKKYKARSHPEVIMGKKTELEKIIEFGECFDINYEISNIEQVKNKYRKIVDFDTFANFYEYVSFIYSDDEDFTNLLISTWY